MQQLDEYLHCSLDWKALALDLPKYFDIGKDVKHWNRTALNTFSKIFITFPLGCSLNLPVCACVRVATRFGLRPVSTNIQLSGEDDKQTHRRAKRRMFRRVFFFRHFASRHTIYENTRDNFYLRENIFFLKFVLHLNKYLKYTHSQLQRFAGCLALCLSVSVSFALLFLILFHWIFDILVCIYIA